MAESVFRIAREPDSKIINNLVGLANMFEGWAFSVSLKLAGQVVATFSSIDDLMSNELVKSIVGLDTIAFDVVAFSFNSIPVEIVRDSDAVNDEVKINSQHALNSGVAAFDVARLISAVRGAFVTIDGIGVIKSLSDPVLVSYLQGREGFIDKIEAVHQKALEDTLARRNALDSEFATKRQEMESEYSRRNSVQDEQYQKKIEDLEHKLQELEDRKRKIDDRENTHVRRETVSNFKAELDKRFQEFKLTDGTVRLRRPIVNAIYVLFAFFVSLTAYYAIDLALHKPSNVYEAISAIAKQVTSILGVATTVLYYIKWNNQWFQKHAVEEFRQKRLYLDVDRANWIVETSLEWKKHTNSEIPSHLLDRLSANLFEEGQPHDDVKHPSEQLLEILKASSSLQIDTPQGSLSFGKKGLKSLSRAEMKASKRKTKAT